jgi:hypothetical protein
VKWHENLFLFYRIFTFTSWHLDLKAGSYQLRKQIMTMTMMASCNAQQAGS